METLKFILASLLLAILFFLLMGRPINESEVTLHNETLARQDALSENAAMSSISVPHDSSTLSEVVREPSSASSVKEREDFCYKEFIIVDGTIHDIPLSKDLQLYTYQTAKEYGVTYETIMAIIGCESGWNVNEKGNGRYVGLGMITISALPELAEYGITDLYDPKQNIETICILMKQKIEMNGGDIHKALMSYNHGQAGAERYFNRGKVASSYSKRVLSFAEAFNN